MPGDHYSIAHSSGDSLLIADVDTVFGWSFNGNDVVALVRKTSDEFVDIIGVVGEKPVESWSMGIGESKDMTMKRKGGINVGSTDWYSSSPLDWDVYVKDDFSVIETFEVSELKKCVISSLSTGEVDESEVLRVYNAIGKEVSLTNAKGLIFIKYENGRVKRFFYE